MGMSLLGLALAGLYYPAVILGSCLALLAGARGFSSRESILMNAFLEARRIGMLGLAIPGIVLVPFAYYFLTPATHIDVFIYHLATPWHYLMNHGAVLNRIPWTSHLPLPVDIAFTLPLILGNDRLAVWLGFACFLAASSVFADYCQKQGQPKAVWLGLLLALGTGYSLILLRYPKNDIAAASLFVAGALAYRGNTRILGSILLWMSIGAKPTYAPLVVSWLIFHPPRVSHALVIAGGAVYWLGPWLLKEYLATGNPLFPFASGIFPSLDWGATNNILTRKLSSAFLHQDTYSISGLASAWPRHLGRDYLLVLLCLPQLLLLSRWRRAAAACALGQIGILGLVHHARYLLPVGWLLSVAIAEEAYRLRGKWRLAAVSLLAGFSLLNIGLTKEMLSFDWRELFRSDHSLQSKRLTTYYETALVLRELEPARLLSIGERRTYLFPGRVIYNGARGETPLIWQLVRESDGLSRLRIKFRQLGARYLAYNYVSAEWLAQLYSPFIWDLRMLRIYAEFCKRHFVPMTHNSRCDFNNGGFFIYEILKVPLTPAPDVAWFMPGTEALFGQCIRLENRGRRAELLDASLAILGMLGDIGHAWNQVGHAYILLNDSPNAFKYLKRFYERGMMDQLNIPEYGAIAIRMGRLEEADAVLQECKWRYPDQIDTIHVNEALLHGRWAYNALLERDLVRTGRHLDVADGLLALVHENTPNSILNGARQATFAALTALRAELLLAQGKRRDAGMLFKTAAQIAPDNPSVERWRGLAAKLAPPRIGLSAGDAARPAGRPEGR